MALSIEQQRVIALAKARKRKAQQQNLPPTRLSPEEEKAEREKAFSQLASDTGPLQAFGVGAAEGVLKLGRLFGFADEPTETEKEAFQALEQESPIATTAGEILGESAPFLIPGLGQAPLAAKLGGSAAARIGTAAGLGALEAGTIAAAEDGDVGLSAGIGGGVAGTLEAILPKLGKAYRVARASKGKNQLITPEGQIAPTFEKALANEGLATKNLVDIAKIPEIAEESVKSGLSQKAAAKIAAKSVVKQQLKSGARDDALAPVMLQAGKVIDDKAAKNAINQGFAEGTVQLAKTANKETQEAMDRALETAFRIKKQSRLAQEMRPSDEAGKALFDRVRFIRGEANRARQELNQIALRDLKDKPFNNTGITTALNDVLEKLDISNLNPGGVPKLDFKGSLISADRSSQKTIKEMVRIMAETKRNDSLGAHMMKKQFDSLINYRKNPAIGLGDEGEKALRHVRQAFNNTLRESSGDYARVNDVMSQSLDAIDDLQTAVGKRTDLGMDNADKAVGDRIRGLFSNIRTRQELSNAFDKLDGTASRLGGDFKTSYKDLSQFTREIEDVFGKTAKTSLGGEVEGAIKSASAQGVSPTLREKAIDRLTERFNKQDDFEAYKAMRELLRRKQ